MLVFVLGDSNNIGPFPLFCSHLNVVIMQINILPKLEVFALTLNSILHFPLYHNFKIISSIPKEI